MARTTRSTWAGRWAKSFEHVRLAVRHHRDPRRAAELPGPPRGRQPADALAVLEGPAQAARPATFGTLQKLRVERAEDGAARRIDGDHRVQITAPAAARRPRHRRRPAPPGHPAPRRRPRCARRPWRSSPPSVTEGLRRNRVMWIPRPPDPRRGAAPARPRAPCATSRASRSAPLFEPPVAETCPMPNPSRSPFSQRESREFPQAQTRCVNVVDNWVRPELPELQELQAHRELRQRQEPRAPRGRLAPLGPRARSPATTAAASPTSPSITTRDGIVGIWGPPPGVPPQGEPPQHDGENADNLRQWEPRFRATVFDFELPFLAARLSSRRAPPPASRPRRSRTEAS